ncbi:MAG: YhbY family RNA-binding protein [Oscillospiraceae bacterium]|jgi:RNA-binding protein|nr:YhbY family RNA-binding protein [Oscillospiraceae bacterium]
MTTRERALLRGYANAVEPVLFIGKDGVTDAVVRSAWDALEARELIKVTVQRGSPYESTRAACDALCERTHADPVQCIGHRFVVYRAARENPELLKRLTAEA